MIFRGIVLLLLTAGICYGGEISFRREAEKQVDLSPCRSKTAPQVLMYTEVQYKYGLFQNYLRYIDRPLFYDRSLRYRENEFCYINKESFLRNCAIRKSYGFDGGGSLCSAIWGLHQTVMGYLAESPELIGKYYEFPQFSFGSSGKNKINPASFDRVLTLAEKSPFTPRINGKIPISTYCSFLVPADRMRELLTTLRRKHGNTFAVCGELFVSPADKPEFYNHGKWSEKTREKYRKRIAEILSVYDGIQIDPVSRRRKSFYQTAPDFTLYDREIEPLLLEALKRKENQNKLVCGSVLHGYINHMSGVNFGEFGTATARGSLNRLARLNCDMIFFFEWNEFNENTCWQPTLYNSLVLQRMIRFYGSTMRQQKPAPNPGDDQEIPPLAVSYRDHLRIGESLQIELLNIPDTDKPASYTVQLELTDIRGKKICTFPEEKFDRAVINAVTYSLPSSKLSTEMVLIPRLKVSGRSGKKLDFTDLQYIQLHTTTNVNYKCVRQTLRDLLPVKMEFSVKDQGSGNFAVTAKAEAGEELASLEVLENGSEVFAAGGDAPEKTVVISGAFNTRKAGMRKVTIRVKNGGKWQFKGADHPNVSLGKVKRSGDEVTLNTLIWSARNCFFITLEKASVPNAILEFEVDNEKYTIPAGQIVSSRIAAHAFPACRLELEHYKLLTDVPPHLNRKSAGFTTVLPANSDYPVYQLRAVSRSGKIFRSNPVIPRTVPEKKEALNIHCEESDLVVTVPVFSALIPRFRWDLNNTSGAVIPSGSSRCDLGGGYFYGGAFTIIKPPAGRNVPVKTVENGETVLKFDGTAYLHFPVETFPRGSFSLDMEIRPDKENTPMIYPLFRHYDNILGSVTVFVKYDRLQLAFADRELKTDLFASGMEITPGKWSKINISYDLKTLQITVNDRKIRYPLNKKLALYFKPAVFGGHTKAEFGLPAGAEFFRGSLKNIAISHNSF